jgi:hypothetical protein
MRRLLLLVMGILRVGAFVSAAQGQTRGGFDAKGRLLMHGTPRFMLGVYDLGRQLLDRPRAVGAAALRRCAAEPRLLPVDRRALSGRDHGWL